MLLHGISTLRQARPAPRPSSTSVVVQDFSGHLFPSELSRQLAGRGFQVEHQSCDQYVGGKGDLARKPGDPVGLRFRGMSVRLPFQKYAPLARIRFEVAYGREWIRHLKRDLPDVVVACNVPLVSMTQFALFARRRGIPYVFWHQDIYSFALEDELRRRLPRPVAALGGCILRAMEAYCARNAEHVVAIADTFSEVYPDWHVDPERVSIIPNWAPLSEIYPVERPSADDTALFEDDDALRLVYAGQIGRKHNPELLVSLLEQAIARGVDASMTIVSEGESADWLAEQAAARGLPLRVLPFAPASELPSVLGAGDVLVSLLEPDASRFSVPSKVLAYMAAGRPILGLMPLDNPSATNIEASGGRVVTPSCAGATDAIDWLLELDQDRSLVTEIGLRARAVAEQKFCAVDVTDAFVDIIATPSEQAAVATPLVPATHIGAA